MKRPDVSIEWRTRQDSAAMARLAELLMGQSPAETESSIPRHRDLVGEQVPLSFEEGGTDA